MREKYRLKIKSLIISKYEEKITNVKLQIQNLRDEQEEKISKLNSEKEKLIIEYEDRIIFLKNDFLEKLNSKNENLII